MPQSSREMKPAVISDQQGRAARFIPGDPAIRVNPELPSRPPWLRVRTPAHGRVREMEALVETNDLHTVCESANCPNRGECWSRGTATIMILGNICTRSCGFCAVQTGRPTELDLNEPARVADAVALMGLNYVVITSVDRDDLKDGGAAVWAQTIRTVRERCPGTGVEVLIPDFQGDAVAQREIFDARPTVLAHNLETVQRLHRTVRPQARYARSLEVVTRAKVAGLIAKSGMMLGLGETLDEVRASMGDLRAAGCDVLSLGQYMQPTRHHLPVERWVHPDEFALLRADALAMGFGKCDSGPLVRSSYHAEEVMADESPLAKSILDQLAARGA